MTQSVEPLHNVQPGFHRDHCRADRTQTLRDAEELEPPLPLASTLERHPQESVLKRVPGFDSWPAVHPATTGVDSVLGHRNDLAERNVQRRKSSGKRREVYARDRPMHPGVKGSHAQNDALTDKVIAQKWSKTRTATEGVQAVSSVKDVEGRLQT